MAWVCLCEGVDDTAIRASIENGACDIAGVAAACGAGSNCHGCHASIDDLLDEHLDPFTRHRTVAYPVRRAS